jgi:VanZ family protein
MCNFASKFKAIMSFLLHFIRKYPISCILFALIWYLSFFTPPKTKLNEVEFIDKWVHISMYGLTCLAVWIEYARQHLRPDHEKLFFWAWLSPIVMSGIIELLQEYATGGRRSGEWLDLAANSTGVTLAAVIGILIFLVRSKR